MRGSVHWVLPMTCCLWLYDQEAVWLSALNYPIYSQSGGVGVWPLQGQWPSMSCMPWSFWHAFSRSLVASLTSLVVTWHGSVEQWTLQGDDAASFIGVGRSIPLGEAVHRVFSRRTAARRPVHTHSVATFVMEIWHPVGAPLGQGWSDMSFIIGCIVCAQRIHGRLLQEVMED